CGRRRPCAGACPGRGAPADPRGAAAARAGAHVRALIAHVPRAARPVRGRAAGPSPLSRRSFMRHSIRYLLPVSLLVGCIGMAGCVPGDERADGNQPSAGEPPVADTSAAATPRADTTEAQSVVSTEAFGPVRIGMSVHELVPHLTADTD